MADKNLCVVPVLNNEDRTGTGIVSTYGNRRTRFGIDEKFNPDMPEDFWTEPAPAALKIAEGVLTTKYWEFDGVKSNRTACKLFDVCVNAGEGEGVMLAQRALNSITPGAVTEDAKFGPKTEAALNAVDADKFITALCGFQAAFYRHIVAVAPTKEHYAQIDGWLARAAFVPSVALDGPEDPPAAKTTSDAV
jgi:lysozyme family protein